MQRTISIFGSYNRQSVGDKAILVSLIHLLFCEVDPDVSLKVLAFDQEAISQELSFYSWSDRVQVLPVVHPRSNPNNKSLLIVEDRNTVSGKPTERSSLAFQQSVLPIVKLVVPRRLRPSLVTWARMLQFAADVNWDAAEGSDGLIIGGGNLLMDIFPDWPVRIFLMMQQFRRMNRPVVLAGVGAFPIRTRLGKYLLKKVAQGSQKVYVRDDESCAYIQHNWGVSAQTHPDFALSFPSGGSYNPDSRRTPVVAVNIAPIFGYNWPYKSEERYQAFIQSVANALSTYHYDQGGNVRFSFYNTNYPTDRLGTVDLIAALKEKGLPDSSIEYEDSLSTSFEIVQRLQGVRFAVTTRLHAALLAIRSGVPVVAIAYQPKVEDVLANLGLAASVVKIEELESGLDQRIRMLISNAGTFSLTTTEIQSLDDRNREIIREIIGTIYPKYA